MLCVQEKRAEQLKALGIQESDIGKDIIEVHQQFPAAVQYITELMKQVVTKTDSID